MTHPVFRPLLALAALTLGGCAAQGDFPSLAPRAVEQLSMEEPVREAPIVAENPALDARVAALLAQARQGQAAFASLLPGATRAAGEAGAGGSESWVAAQMAISRLEAAAAPTTTALAELDRLRIERAGQPTNQDDYAELLAAVEAVATLARGQHDAVGRLRSLLSPL